MFAMRPDGIPHQQQWMRGALNRYLASYAYDIDDALRRLRATAVWRVDEVDPLRWDDVAAAARTGSKFVASALDRSDHPVVVLRPRAEKILDGAGSTEHMDAQLRLMVYTMERAVAQLPPHRESLTVVVDFTDCCYGDMPSLATGKQIIHVFENHFPNRLHRFLLVSAPRWMSWLWSTIKPFVHKQTRRKIAFVKHKHLAEHLHGDHDDATHFDLEPYAASCRAFDATRDAARATLAKTSTATIRAEEAPVAAQPQ